MRLKALIVGGILLAGGLSGTPARAAFRSLSTLTLTASAVIGAGSPVAGFAISVSTLPVDNVFFGKSVVIPVSITSTGPIDPKSLVVSMLFQTQSGIGLSGPPKSVSIAYSVDPVNRNMALGKAIIPGDDPYLLFIQNGGKLGYVFIAKQGGAGTLQQIKPPGR